MSFGTTCSSTFGNALITVLPFDLKSFGNWLYSDKEEIRGMMKISLEHFDIFLTHLDHVSEPVRLKQLKKLMEKALTANHRPHILMGDFNSLTNGDYSQTKIKSITKTRKMCNWELPVYDVIEMLVSIGI
eukprot:TRINITY_DN1365_c0_g1_i3.p1 TRINITY_DN1365_c0_g1~~TRINITY_DN1365_c0_g1_i3.p1  ORF type:complete len:130 (+),score=20.96 TRINITY_DN1365_c0_g1_i3:281-670(+)